jgi:hypothetical protein
LYCRTAERRLALRIVKAVALPYALEGEESDWTSLRITGAKGTLTFNALVYCQAGDTFSVSLGGAIRYAEEELVAKSEEVRRQVLAHLEETKLAVGVVADPGFDADPRFEQPVFLIAQNLNAILFNGHATLNAFGAVLMEMKDEEE